MQHGPRFFLSSCPQRVSRWFLPVRRLWPNRNLPTHPALESRVHFGTRGLASGGRHDAAHKSRVAVLVDGDNVPSRLARVILDEIDEHVGGHQVDRRVYGDFSLPRIEAWKVASLEHGFACIFQASAKGTKNATDIALSIDAMDILHAGTESVDTFVIVTNDGDFAPLAQRLRRSGKRVVAVGTGAALMASCDAHVAINFSRVPDVRLHQPRDVQTLTNQCFELASSKLHLLLESASDLAAMEKARAAGQDWVGLGALASQVDGNQPGWRRARLGDFVNWKHMLECAPYVRAFEVQRPGRAAQGGHQKPRVRLRDEVFDAILNAKRAELQPVAEVDEAECASGGEEVRCIPQETQEQSRLLSWLYGLRGARWSSATWGSKAAAQSATPRNASSTSLVSPSSPLPSSPPPYSPPAASPPAASPPPSSLLVQAQATPPTLPSLPSLPTLPFQPAPLSQCSTATDGSPSAADVTFVSEVIRAASSGTLAVEGMRFQLHGQTKMKPEGSGWVYLSDLALLLDKQAVSSGRGHTWRALMMEQVGSARSLRGMCEAQPFAAQLEVTQVRLNPSHVDTWVRLRPARG